MDDRRFPPSQDPPIYTGDWSFDDLLAQAAIHHHQQATHPPHPESSTRQRSRSLSIPHYHNPYIPPETMPNTSQLDLLAALAQNPALASPLQTGREADFNHSLFDALRIIAANMNAMQAENAQAPHQPPQAPYYSHGPPPPPFQIPGPPHIGQHPTSAGSSNASPPIDPLLYFLQQNAQAGAQPQSVTGSAAAQTSGAGPSRLPDPQGAQPTTRGRARSNVSRRGAASAPASPVVQTPAFDRFPSPPLPPIDPDDPVAVEEDKRRRNTAASARFRAKKKQQVNNLEMTISDLTSRADELEREAADLRRENGWLKEIVMLKGRTMAGHAITPPDAPREQDRNPDRSQGA